MSLETIDRMRKTIMEPLHVSATITETGIWRNIERPFGDTGSLIDMSSQTSLTEIQRHEMQKYPKDEAKIDLRNKKFLVITKEQKKAIHYNKSAELARYMRKHYQVQLTPEDRRKSETEMAYRMVDLSRHKQTVRDYFMHRKERIRAETTGFLSDVTKPYRGTGEFEPDLATLVFRNLPESVKIDSTEWIKTQFQKLEEKRMRETPLPTYPRVKMVRPKLSGKHKKSVGGLGFVDTIVKAGENFQRATKGTYSYQKCVTQHMSAKETEHIKKSNTFGLVPSELATKYTEEELEELRQKETAMLKEEFESRARDKTFLKELEDFELMLHTILDILRVMMNIKWIHLKAKVPISVHVLRELRSHDSHGHDSKKHRTSKQLEPGHHRNNSSATDKPPKGSLKTEEQQHNLPFNPTTAPASGQQLSQELFQNEMEDYINDRLRFETNRARLLSSSTEDLKNIVSLLPLRESSSKTKHHKVVDILLKMLHSKEYMLVGCSHKNHQHHHQLHAHKEKLSTTIAALEKHNLRFKTFFNSKISGVKPIWHKFLRKRSVSRNSISVDIDEIMSGNTEPPCGGGGLEEVEASTSSAAEQPSGPSSPKSGILYKKPHIRTPQIPHKLRSLRKLSSEEQSMMSLISRIPTGASNFEMPPSIKRLNEKAGVEFTDKDMFNHIMGLKKRFYEVEKNIRILNEEQADKVDWDTMERFYDRINRNVDNPVFARSIAMFRKKSESGHVLIGGKRPAQWYTTLVDIVEEKMADQHQGCGKIMRQLEHYCDVGVSTKKQMTARMILTITSLPAPELAKIPVQRGILFLLENLFQIVPGSKQLKECLVNRNLPYLLDCVDSGMEKKKESSDMENSSAHALYMNVTFNV